MISGCLVGNTKGPKRGAQKGVPNDPSEGTYSGPVMGPFTEGVSE